MHTGHLLLGRSWWFEMRVIHGIFKNRYLFVKDEKSITLAPLSLKQVHDRQLKLKRNGKAQESENTNLIASLEIRERLDSAKKEKLETWSRVERKIEGRKKGREKRVLR